MKIIIKKRKSNNKEKYVFPIKSKYPYIGEDQHGQIVLFVSFKTGILIGNPKGQNKVGDYSTTWAEYLFKKIKEEFTLKNEA